MSSKGTPMTPQEEQAILADIDAGMHRNEVARQHGRSPSTVSLVAKKHGRSFDRTKTAQAAEAAKADNAARRARLSADALAKAQAAVDRMGEPAVMRAVTPKGEVVEVTLPVPTAQDQERLARAASLLAKSHLDLSARDERGGPEETHSLAEKFAEALGIEYR